MGMALSSSVNALLAPLEPALRWLRGEAANQLAARPAPNGVRPPTALRVVGRPGHRAMPLRVIRVIEVGAQSAQAGRMVISGRMADVCAELDRMAAREAATARASM